MEKNEEREVESGEEELVLLIIIYLAINFVNFGGRIVEGQEQVISTPLDEFSSMCILINSHILLLILKHTPA